MECIWEFKFGMIIHSFTQCRHMTLTMFLNVIYIGYNAFSADLG